MQNARELVVLTVGHLTHTYERFLRLLRSASITAIADVRSSPYSRLNPQFNANNLKDELRLDGIAYSFLGDELGGRPKFTSLYTDGIADYEKMACTDIFRMGLSRVVNGAMKFRIALVCSEHDPVDCHRCLLVGRALQADGVNVEHILMTGEIKSQAVLEKQLLESAGVGGDDMFSPLEDRLAAAYRQRAQKVAFAEPTKAGLGKRVAAE